MEDVAKILASGGFEGVARAHNTALASERERYDDLQRSVMDLSHPNCKGLLDERNEAQEQLAAEREKVRPAIFDPEHYPEDRITQLQDQPPPDRRP
jgi:hypothetical protein